jgi:long-chain acyl-CoA synthetase
VNIADLLRATAQRVPDKQALLEVSGAMTSFAEFDAEVDRVAAALQEWGLQPGDRVAIVMPNHRHFPFSHFGVLRAGGVVVPTNVMLTAPEMKKVFSDAEVRFVLASPPFAQVAAEGIKETSVERLLSTDDWSSLGDIGQTPNEVSRSEDDLAVLAYTSGTTGEPRGAMLTHGNLLANLRQQMAIPDAKVEEDDVLFLALPMFHIFGLNVPLGLLVLNGASGVLLERFEPIATLKLIQDRKVSVLFGAPTMYAAWADTPGADQYDLSSVRLAISGAAPLSPAVLDAFNDMFGVQIYEGYGMTETAPTLTTNRMAEGPRPGSIGKPLPEVEIRLVDDEGNDVEFGDPGELWVKGPNVFQGYWNRTAESDACFTDGWFRTGDIGVKDEEGYLYLVDRKRDLIIVSGFNVFPSEVEGALLQNPKVADAGVVGEKHPYTGESVKAFVVLHPGETADQAELLEDVQTRLARFKCPAQIEIVESLPRLLTGKVLRRALRT